MKKQGETTTGDVMTRRAADFKGKITQHIEQGIERCTKDGGLALVDIFHDRLLSGNKDMESADVSAAPTVQYHSNHKTFEEGIAMLQGYGHVKDVPGDGSCGYHALMLLLQTMNIIDKNILCCSVIMTMTVSYLNQIVITNLGIQHKYIYMKTKCNTQ
jgi:hypothetical protein